MDFVGKQDDALVLTGHDSIESVLTCLQDKITWISYKNYPKAFGTSNSSCVDYKDEECQLYTSLYRTLIN